MKEIMKRQGTDWTEVFVVVMMGKGCRARSYKECLKITGKKDILEKCPQMLNI